MVIKNLTVLVLWAKVASALKGLRKPVTFERCGMFHYYNVGLIIPVCDANQEGGISRTLA